MSIENISADYLEELYQNVTRDVNSHQKKRKNKWSSQFEMPIYPWMLPCANFPKCEAVNDILRDFSHLEPMSDGQINHELEDQEQANYEPVNSWK